jgi:hypothetical protein
VISSSRQSWARAFFYASRSLAELFALALSRSFLGLKFSAFAFALPRSLIFRALFRAPRFFALPDFSRFFSRSSIFCVCTFAIIDFRARNFVLVRLYTARIGQPGQDTQNKTARTGQAEQNRLNRTGRTGQAKHDRQNKIGRTG